MRVSLLHREQIPFAPQPLKKDLEAAIVNFACNDGAISRHYSEFTCSLLRRNFMPNPFAHLELNTTDLDQSKAFYSKLFDWELKDTEMPSGTYTTFGAGKGAGGGMMRQPIPGAPSFWVPYVEVTDIKASTALARTLGATVHLDSEKMPGIGSISVLQDPAGASFGLWESEKK
jgi:predicted enzyme related to lactoylglutathione lyase